MTGQLGVVYMLHFDRPYKHARHYVGWTARNVKRRLAEHEAGRGARLLSVVRAAGIGWQLAGCGRAAGTVSGRSSGKAGTLASARCAASSRGACRGTRTGRCRAAGPLMRRSSRQG